MAGLVRVGAGVGSSVAAVRESLWVMLRLFGGPRRLMLEAAAAAGGV